MRFVVSIFTQDRNIKYLFLVVIPVVGLLTFDGYEDILAIASGTFATLGVFQKDDKVLRHFMFIASLSIITHNVIIFTPAGIFVETFFLLSNLVAYWRFYIKGDSKES